MSARGTLSAVPREGSTSVASFLSGYRFISLAGTEDEVALRAFERTSSMSFSGLAIRYDRGPDFFALTRERGARGWTIVLRKRDGEIGGMASLVVRDVWIHGQPAEAAYLGDLRFSPSLSMAARVEFHGFYQRLVASLNDIAGLEGVASLYTAIVDGNHIALQSLTGKRAPVHYRKLARYRVAHVLARRPGATSGPVERVPTSDRDLDAFVASERIDYASTSGIEAGSTAWVVRERGEILASCRPWIQTSRRLVTPSVPWRFRALFGALRLAGRPPLRADTPVDICYLTGFTVSRRLAPQAAQQAASRLVSGVVAGFHREAGIRPHWFAVSDVRARPLLDQVLRKHVCVETGGTIYDVHPREHASTLDAREVEVGWELALA